MCREGREAHKHPRAEVEKGDARPETSVQSATEGDEGGFTLRVDLDAAVGAEGRAQDAAVLRERVGIPLGAELVQSAGSSAPRR